MGGERRGGKAGRGSENKVPFIAAIATSEEGHPLKAKLSIISGFSKQAIRRWAQTNLATGASVCSDGLGAFRGFAAAGFAHQATVVAGRKPDDVPELGWINTLLGNLKTSLAGIYHACKFGKYAQDYLSAFTYRFNRRFDLRSLPKRLLIAAVQTPPHSQRSIRRPSELR